MFLADRCHTRDRNVSKLIFSDMFYTCNYTRGEREREGGGIQHNGNKQSLFIVDKESMICYG